MEKRVVVLLSGGLDSTIAMRMCVDKYGADNVEALSFNYGQKQSVELERAAESTALLKVNHTILDLPVLGIISRGFSANTDADIAVPGIKEVIGDAQPVTYVPNRNMILMALAASFAEVQKCSEIITGYQVHDEFGYHDTTQMFVDSINSALVQNRSFPITVTAPYVGMSKTEELTELMKLDGNVRLTAFTISCYDPVEGKSCGKCGPCSERIQAFMNMKLIDPITYVEDIAWVTE